MLRKNAAKLMKDLDLAHVKDVIKDVDWKSLRDGHVRGMKDAVNDAKRMSSARTAKRGGGKRRVVIGMLVGALLMYFFDRQNGALRRSSAGERLMHWYLRGRGQLDGAWRQLQAEHPAFDRPSAEESAPLP